MDLVKVANACAVECVRQKVGLIELTWLIGAYDMMLKGYQLDSYDAIVGMGRMIEPRKNEWGFRITPVTFQNGGSSCQTYLIHDKIDNLVENIQSFRQDPPPRVASHEMAVDFESLAKALTKEFLWIHPFGDGNGRTGFLLWNWLMGTLDEPTALPDFNW